MYSASTRSTRRTSGHALPLALALAVAVATAGAASAQCNTQLFYGDFKLPFVTHFAGSPVHASPDPPVATTDTNAACAGWFKTTLRLDIPATCSKAIVQVAFEGDPIDWSLNIGNSPSNDGFGGDGGNNGGHNAELWILGDTLAVANASANPALIDNPLLTEGVALKDGSLKFVVMNQAISWGQPYSLLQAPASKNLFAIPNPDVPTADSRAIYVGINSVVSGDPSRAGCGVKSVLVSFE